MSRIKFIQWIFIALFVPSLAMTLILSLSLCVMNRTDANFLLENLRNAPSGILVLNIFISTALVALIAATNVQSDQQQATGFSIFLSGLSKFKALPILMDEFKVNSNDVRINEWTERSHNFIHKMNEITPFWEGFNVSTKPGCSMIKFVGKSNGLLYELIDTLDDAGKIVLLRIIKSQDVNLREMMNGLILMDRGAIGEWRLRSLLGIFTWIALILVSSLAAQVDSTLAPVNFYAMPAWLNLSLHIFPLVGFITSLVYFLCAVYFWRRDVGKGKELWASLNRTLEGGFQSAFSLCSIVSDVSSDDSVETK